MICAAAVCKNTRTIECTDGPPRTTVLREPFKWPYNDKKYRSSNHCLNTHDPGLLHKQHKAYQQKRVRRRGEKTFHSRTTSRSSSPVAVHMILPLPQPAAAGATCRRNKTLTTPRLLSSSRHDRRSSPMKTPRRQCLYSPLHRAPKGNRPCHSRPEVAGCRGRTSRRTSLALVDVGVAVEHQRKKSARMLRTTTRTVSDFAVAVVPVVVPVPVAVARIAAVAGLAGSQTKSLSHRHKRKTCAGRVIESRGRRGGRRRRARER